MKLSETDIETLELYLDEELSDQDRAAVVSRLANEPVLATELTRLRNDRELRFAVFSGGGQFSAAEFSAKSMDEMILSVRAAQASEALRLRRTGPWRTVASAAAALLVGVVLGLGAAHQSANTGMPPGSNASFGASLGPANTSGITPVNFPAELPQPYGQHVVIVSDPSGRILQRLVFPTAEAAQQYVEDFRQQSTEINRRSTQEIKVMSESY